MYKNKGEKGEPGDYLRGQTGLKGDKGQKGQVGPMGPSGLQPDITKHYRIYDKITNNIFKLFPKKSNTNYIFNKSFKLDRNSIIIDLEGNFSVNPFL